VLVESAQNTLSIVQKFTGKIMNPMNWNDFRFFLALARTGRLSVAGRQLGVDHATVARRIKSLEQSLNSILFDRAPTGYSLTRVGKDLVPIAERMESEAILVQDSFGGQQKNLSGHVRIGVPEGIATYVVVKAAQELCENYPRLEIQLVALPQKFSLSKREADFVIAVSQPQSGRLRVQKIADYKLHLVGSKKYLKSQQEIKQISDLKKLRGIGYVTDLIFDEELNYVPLVDPSFHPRFTSTSVLVQLQAVLNGAGVGILPDFMTASHDDLQKVLPSEISFKRAFWFIVHEDYAQLERIRVCASALIGTMQTALRGV